jgi:hypothetical protein
MDRRGIGLGVALVAVGVYVLLSRRLGFHGPGPVLLLLGAVVFALSALSRFRGPLLPAGVLLGLGAGLLLRDTLEPWEPRWAAILLGLGGGFLLVAAIDRALGRRRRPPPIVPGAILTGIALAAIAGRTLRVPDLLEQLEPLWPFLVLAAGLFLVATALRKRRT